MGRRMGEGRGSQGSHGARRTRRGLINGATRLIISRSPNHSTNEDRNDCKNRHDPGRIRRHRAGAHRQDPREMNPATRRSVVVGNIAII